MMLIERVRAEEIAKGIGTYTAAEEQHVWNKYIELRAFFINRGVDLSQRRQMATGKIKSISLGKWAHKKDDGLVKRNPVLFDLFYCEKCNCTIDAWGQIKIIKKEK